MGILNILKFITFVTETKSYGGVSLGLSAGHITMNLFLLVSDIYLIL